MARSVESHKAGCACPACTNRGRGETEVFRFRLRPELAAWLREQGGAEFLRALLERERAETLSGEPEGQVLFGKDIAVVVTGAEDPYFLAIERGVP